MLKLSEISVKFMGFQAEKWGGSAKPEPKPLKFWEGGEPLGPIEVYAYDITHINTTIKRI
jgi:hypothetical protein